MSDSAKDRPGVACLPWPAMMPDRIGIIGNTQGVKASSSPKPKKDAITTRMFPRDMRSASRSCSATLGSTEVPAGASAGVPAGGKETLRVLVIGG